eukprot:CAMPEP_0184030162 /NCGR_PEP_ID=MMETSP0955-20130417/1215_1 /TAXON_ID=627963 /ORGANISM="Aplanochytrium sp, Strain PBS07" /LENGTH=344 /DNA_ID=CAMNT_0026315449 /DNA_START=158 /DNA_END=1192 /DNA_ORIENTATION=+
MVSRSFRACVVSQPSKGVSSHEIVEVTSAAELPQPLSGKDDLSVVKVEWSTLNYKDGLVLEGQPGVAKKFPIVPGIDCSGAIETCTSGKFQEGDKVVLTGNYAGQHFDGCYSEKVVVPTSWLVKLPSGISTKESMIIGTAGFTAMQSIMSLERHLGPKLSKNDPILVTGATGGVGSTAVGILANLGYTNIVASTGKVETSKEWLISLGAKEVVGRIEPSKRPMSKEKYLGVIDSVGGGILSTCLSETKYGGCVTCCGLAASATIDDASVFPFILRGVSLIGIDSVQLPMDDRRKVWDRLQTDFPKSYFQLDPEILRLEDLKLAGEKILKGEIKGRMLVSPKSKL